MTYKKLFVFVFFYDCTIDLEQINKYLRYCFINDFLHVYIQIIVGITTDVLQENV